MTANLFATTHSLPIATFPEGAKVYYRITLTDRSGNQFTSAELTFQPSLNLYLPFTGRTN